MPTLKGCSGPWATQTSLVLHACVRPSCPVLLHQLASDEPWPASELVCFGKARAWQVRQVANTSCCCAASASSPGLDGVQYSRTAYYCTAVCITVSQTAHHVSVPTPRVVSSVPPCPRPSTLDPAVHTHPHRKLDTLGAVGRPHTRDERVAVDYLTLKTAPGRPPPPRAQLQPPSRAPCPSPPRLVSLPRAPRHPCWPPPPLHAMNAATTSVTSPTPQALGRCTRYPPPSHIQNPLALPPMPPPHTRPAD